MRPIAILATLAILLAVSACGLKGDLYLPAPKPAPTATPPAPDEPPGQKEDESTPGAKAAPEPQ